MYMIYIFFYDKETKRSNTYSLLILTPQKENREFPSAGYDPNW